MKANRALPAGSNYTCHGVKGERRARFLSREHVLGRSCHFRKENCLRSKLPKDTRSEEFLCGETRRNCYGSRSERRTPRFPETTGCPSSPEILRNSGGHCKRDGERPASCGVTTEGGGSSWRALGGGREGEVTASEH